MKQIKKLVIFFIFVLCLFTFNVIQAEGTNSITISDWPKLSRISTSRSLIYGNDLTLPDDKYYFIDTKVTDDFNHLTYFLFENKAGNLFYIRDYLLPEVVINSSTYSFDEVANYLLYFDVVDEKVNYVFQGISTSDIDILQRGYGCFIFNDNESIKYKFYEVDYNIQTHDYYIDYKNQHEVIVNLSSITIPYILQNNLTKENACITFSAGQFRNDSKIESINKDIKLKYFIDVEYDDYIYAYCSLYEKVNNNYYDPLVYDYINSLTYSYTTVTKWFHIFPKTYTNTRTFEEQLIVIFDYSSPVEYYLPSGRLYKTYEYIFVPGFSYGDYLKEGKSYDCKVYLGSIKGDHLIENRIIKENSYETLQITYSYNEITFVSNYSNEDVIYSEEIIYDNKSIFDKIKDKLFNNNNKFNMYIKIVLSIVVFILVLFLIIKFKLKKKSKE